MAIDPNKSPLYIIGFAAVISAIFTAAIMALHVATAPIVERNRRLLVEKALVELFQLGDPEAMSAEEVASLVRRRVAGYNPGEVAGATGGKDLPGTTPEDLRRREITITDPRTGTKIPLYVAFKQDLPSDEPPRWRDKSQVIAYAFPIDGVGFWAGIDGLLALQPDLERTLGMVILNHQETPGLGGRITESRFRGQFIPSERANDRGVLVTIPADGQVVRMSKDTPPPTSDAYERHMDSITGATGTSTALANFLNEDIRMFQRAAKAAGLK